MKYKIVEYKDGFSCFYTVYYLKKFLWFNYWVSVKNSYTDHEITRNFVTIESAKEWIDNARKQVSITEIDY